MIHKQSFIFILILFLGCDNTPTTPKQKTYFRIDLPPATYKTIEVQCPYLFEINNISQLKAVQRKDNTCWFNIDYPALKATLHISYIPINNNIQKYLEDSRSLVYKHTVKATDIRENLFLNDSNKTYAMVYELYGNTASSLQFHITDSSSHFLRGALYFNIAPNSDSLEPVIKYIKEDVKHLIESTKWKK